MKYLFYLLLISEVFGVIQGQCSGGIWPIQDPTIGSFTVSWRYNVASNTVQFIIQGQAIPSINLTSTYIAIGWSNTAPTMNNMDVAMFFPGTQIVQDRFSQGHVVPSVDAQQDFCVFRTNISDQNVYVAFERFIQTGDSHDISFTQSLYLMFSMGLYTLSNNGTNFNPQYHFFRIPFQTLTNLLTCVSNSCSTISCTTASCPCLQQIISGSAQCVCFPPSSCVSGSTITLRTTMPTLLSSSLSTINNDSCQNQVNPCSSNGICYQTSSMQYICQCKTNYTGVFCQTPLFTNNSMNTNTCQCVNGGTCLTNGTCLCMNRYRGKFCQLNNPCIGYCHDNSTCSVVCTDTSCNTPNCTCRNGSTGVQCDIIAGGVCQSNTCINGNCVMLTNGSSQCLCLNGFFGTRCELISSCLSNPCNQGTCLVSSNCVGILCSYSCLCPNGTTGKNCEIGANPCLNTPCKNNGSCTILSNSYLCQCIPPYGGTNCDIMMNVCTPDPCSGHGNCIRSLNVADGIYRCECLNGYTGAHCECLSSCISSPCQNNGQCISTTTNYSSTTCVATCLCLSGTTGTYCEQIITSCLTSPCLNGGTCSINPITNSHYCQCPLNTIGTRCETLQSTCTSTTCSNHGVCYVDALSSNNTLRCVCSEGYTGLSCQLSLNSSRSCAQNPCGYNGTCLTISNSSYYCICSNGLTGLSCNTNLLASCSDSPCHYLSTCQPISNTTGRHYQCICPDYLTGSRCQYTNNCQKQPCYNQGSCIPLGPQNNFMCSCEPGFGNYDCSIYLGLSCNSNVCLNGGTCHYNNTNILCVCPMGFTGARCEWTLVCSTNTCLNGGTCRQTAPTMVECLCATGFTGPTCSLRDSCANFPCKNGGGCATLLTNTGTIWSAYRCSCPPGFFGENCDTLISSCASMVCPAYQICSEQPTGPICTCSGSKVGTFCQYNNPCSLSSSTLCLNGGTCVSTNTDPPIASCLCPQGFSGQYCTITLQNDACTSNPCQTRGYCALSTSNTSYTCICQTNYTGVQCERSNPCLSSPCLNGAVCQSYWNTTSTWFTCSCVGTYTGTRCETSLLNPCSGLCMNGSPCVNGVCVCPAQYTGTFCGFINPCNNAICQHGGLCTANYNSTSASFNCTCPSLYTGQYCENSLYALGLALPSCQSTCMNGGSCINGGCVCTSQYIGSSCQYVNPCLSNNPCLNSGTCFGQYNISGFLYTQCFCLQEYTGMYCEASLCSATSCNGGVCTAAQNTFVCTCPTGKGGDRCQYINACMSNPCLSTEQCEQIANNYRCTSCYDKSTFCSTYQNHTEFCDGRYSLLINNTYLSVIDACPYSCGMCISVNRLNDISPLVTINYDNGNLKLKVEEEGDDDYTTESTTTDSSSTTTTTTTTFGLNIIFSRAENCFDKRDDCSMQKAYGFCEIFNEKYPYDCIQTCNPDCASSS